MRIGPSSGESPEQGPRPFETCRIDSDLPHSSDDGKSSDEDLFVLRSCK
ncbi:MAG: hypothetical protein GVY07_04320 [Bacteroidetes bacterium]|nr:hypothetical protein [Bacteroidota bacterium]